MSTGSSTAVESPNRLLAKESENGAASAFGQLLEKPIGSIYDKISDPLSYVEKMGEAYAKAGVAGVSKPAEGMCLAWALMEMRKNWIEFASQYHMVQGKPTLQAHEILARIRKSGGDCEWIDDGEKLIEAKAAFTISGRRTEVSYSMATAKLAGVIKKDGGWEKNPAAMLRAALLRKAAKMLCPEVLTGDVDPEEFSSDDAPAAAAKAGRSKAEIEKRRQELEAGSATTTSDPVKTETVAAAAKTEDAPFDANVDLPASGANATAAADANKELTVVLLEIEATIGDVGMTKAALEAGLKAKNPAFTTLDDLPIDKAKALLENLRAKLAKK
jgi:hypothetical protein